MALNPPTAAGVPGTPVPFTATVVDAAGKRFEYDSRGNLVWTVDPDGYVSEAYFDPDEGLPVAVLLTPGRVFFEQLHD